MPKSLFARSNFFFSGGGTGFSEGVLGFVSVETGLVSTVFLSVIVVVDPEPGALNGLLRDFYIFAIIIYQIGF